MECEAVWPEGCMEFRIKGSYYKRFVTFRSEHDECPDMFIARVIKSCRRWSGSAVKSYLIRKLNSMKDDDIKGW